MMSKKEIREQMREAYESVMILEAQSRLSLELARAGSIDKLEAEQNMRHALVEVQALKERHTSLRLQWERMLDD